MEHTAAAAEHAIDVFLADDNLIVREGVRALIERNTDLRVVGVAADYDGVVAGCAESEPQVLVTDVRMPPSFHREGIDAAKEVRKRHPGTGIVVLSQYDDPEYAVSLLAEGSAGYGYLLKDRVAEGNQLADAIRAVATGGTALDPAIVEALVRPVVTPGRPAAGRGGTARAWSPRASRSRPSQRCGKCRPRRSTPRWRRSSSSSPAGVAAGNPAALNRLRLLHQAIVDREEQGETLSRLLPGGLAEKLRDGRQRIGETERVIVTVLMSDIRSYSTIAEHADPSQLAGQLNTHRAAMNRAILGEGGTVMQFVGDAVMAVFGAPFPQPDHADRAVAAATAMHALQAEINTRLGGRRAARFRPWHRAVHRRGRRRAARLRGTAGVHARRRHRQPVPAAAAARGGRRDRAVRGHQQGPDRAGQDGRAARPAGQGPRYAHNRLQAHASSTFPLRPCRRACHEPDDQTEYR